ncbi:MAG: adenosylcobinamide-phosphate synthase CbiB [Alphaproteobacteria bacterium]|nr:adenosylcobinamide-phosphate synthase CbiB [Alphaproteobacteria bacterium]MBU1562769.1 adenosylcobinamide-phosphate synthase CbiB [Alphaproteobacteria bacterium]MBU2303525.1 adenosylcobinamide-phosphate synthase CbiB [Alphaproteobacteria bacterium]MBU2367050.1 adenosylcobinamide-phosphate synthase CbiB [Alphaproteobacteria bacterium]
MHAMIAPLALLLERWFGYPQRLVELIGHPVIWMGRFISFMERGVDKRQRTPRQRRDAGILTLAMLLLVTLGITLAVQQVLRSMPLGWVLEIMLATPFLAQKELGRAVEAVAIALRSSLDAGREAVSHIVGRDPQALDEAGVARAAIETLAESTSDGVVAPWFWLVLLGLPGIALYKAINTADSMIGHMDERYRDYGWAAAKLDDLANWIPARLTAVLITAACFVTPHASPGKAWAVARRDARKHASPNSGWPEASFAGALGFRLGGPRSYDGEIVDLPSFGDGKSTLVGSDILRALVLYRSTLNVLLGMSVVLAVLVWVA